MSPPTSASLLANLRTNQVFAPAAIVYAPARRVGGQPAADLRGHAVGLAGARLRKGLALGGRRVEKLHLQDEVLLQSAKTNFMCND